MVYIHYFTLSLSTLSDRGYYYVYFIVVRVRDQTGQVFQGPAATSLPLSQGIFL